MKFLLDTHIFLRYVSGDTRLSVAILENIRNSDNEIYLSVVSLWEAIIKYYIGKLPLPEAPERYIPKQRNHHLISNLTLDEASVCHLAKLPMIHRDPFDRMLICQAIEHDLTIITLDDEIRAYAVKILK